VEVARRELKVRVCGTWRVWNIFIVQKKMEADL
jgi:hypothetical protein